MESTRHRFIDDLDKTERLLTLDEITMKGTVKFYNDERGFGFIAHEDGRDSFFHHSQIITPGRLDQGDLVQFDIEQRDRGRTRAKAVKLLR